MQLTHSSSPMTRNPKAMSAGFLPKTQVPDHFVRNVLRTIEQYPRLGQTRQKLPLMPILLKRDFRLLALVADVDDAIANLNIVLGDLDKLGLGPFSFGDADPLLRFKFLLRSENAEFGRLTECFNQYLNFCGSAGELSQLEQRNLKALFGERLGLLIDTTEADVTAIWRGTERDHIRFHRGAGYLLSRSEAARRNPVAVVDWDKVLLPRIRRRRRVIFDTGMRLAVVWANAIELSASSMDARTDEPQVFLPPRRSRRG
jgi:hypothetical protein